ncbi:hypothetical protein Fot_34697 [Forsythia ovata]|uniref:Uncharacterized protein n=1 Tax=Forsythia ovata TaxID=205694 RepID=A0ABD1SKV7_9LAMI
MSWEEGLAKKDEELGILNVKVVFQDLALAEMLVKTEALQADLVNFKDSDEEKWIFEDGKQDGVTELLKLIKDELPDINFNFLYEEGEITALALLLEVDNDEAVIALTSEIVLIPEVVACQSMRLIILKFWTSLPLLKLFWSKLLGLFLPKLQIVGFSRIYKICNTLLSIEF